MDSTVSTEVLASSLGRFILGTLVPEATSTMSKFILGATAVAATKLANGLKTNDTAKRLGIVDENGNVDIRALRELAIGGINASGPIDIGLGFGHSLRITESDAERFFESVGQ